MRNNLILPSAWGCRKRDYRTRNFFPVLKWPIASFLCLQQVHFIIFLWYHRHSWWYPAIKARPLKSQSCYALRYALLYTRIDFSCSLSCYPAFLKATIIPRQSKIIISFYTFLQLRTGWVCRRKMRYSYIRDSMLLRYSKSLLLWNKLVSLILRSLAVWSEKMNTDKRDDIMFTNNISKYGNMYARNR